MRHHPIKFLPDSITDNLDAAQLLTDDIVPVALRLITDHAQHLARSENILTAACMKGAALIYDQAARATRAIKGTHTSPSYGPHTHALLMRLAVADSLTHRAGTPFNVACALGHLAYPIGDQPDLRDAVARNTDLTSTVR